MVTVSGSAVPADGVQVGSYTFTGGQMQVSFGAQATQDRVDRLRATSSTGTARTPPASVTIAWTLADGNTGAQGSGGALVGAGSVTVAITAVNDAPTLALLGRQSTRSTPCWCSTPPGPGAAGGRCRCGAAAGHADERWLLVC